MLVVVLRGKRVRYYRGALFAAVRAAIHARVRSGDARLVNLVELAVVALVQILSVLVVDRHEDVPIRGLGHKGWLRSCEKCDLGDFGFPHNGSREVRRFECRKRSAAFPFTGVRGDFITRTQHVLALFTTSNSTSYVERSGILAQNLWKDGPFGVRYSYSRPKGSMKQVQYA